MALSIIILVLPVLVLHLTDHLKLVVVGITFLLELLPSPVGLLLRLVLHLLPLPRSVLLQLRLQFGVELCDVDLGELVATVGLGLLQGDIQGYFLL